MHPDSGMLQALFSRRATSTATGQQRTKTATKAELQRMINE